MVAATEIWEALRRVSDPEYPLSIVDMGMVYDVAVADDRATVVMTFTSIGCPAIDMISADVREAVLGVHGIAEVSVDVVWSPPWTKDRISERGQKVLAYYGVVN